MTVGILKIALHIPGCNSLKGKRQVLLSLRDLLRRRFNISLAEVDSQDKWQRAVLAIATVASERVIVDRGLAKVVDFIREFKGVELLDYEVELL